MGWRGALRSIEAASRAAQRDADRRRKIALKAEIVASAAEAVEAWEGLIDNLTHARGDGSEPIDWKRIAGQPAPSEPQLRSVHTVAAKRALDAFRPQFLDFLSGGSEKKRARLQANLASAPALDTADFAVAKADYAKAHGEWSADVETASGVLRGDPQALKSVIEAQRPFPNDGYIGSSITFSFGEDFVHAAPTVHGTDVIPATRLKQTAAGKLSETKMPASQFNEIYQDYVASVPLRIARTIFAMLPLSELYVTCRAMMLNTQTGHQELTPILSVLIVRDTFARLDIGRADPSDALANFKHVMAFKKTGGFQRIEPLKALS